MTKSFQDWRDTQAIRGRAPDKMDARQREAEAVMHIRPWGPRISLPRNQWTGLEGPAMAILENYIDELAQERDTAPDELSRELITFAINLVAMRAALPE